MDIKTHSTGDNDSLEDVLIALCNIKTTDGKYLGFKDALILINDYALKRDQAIKELMETIYADKSIREVGEEKSC